MIQRKKKQQIKNDKKKMKKILKFMPLLKMIAKAKLTKKNVPIRLDFNITKKCNLRCKYCYIDFEELKKHKELSTDRIKTIILDWHKLGTRWMRLLGGEPLLRDDIGEIIRFSQSKGIIVEVNTNGILIKERLKQLETVDSVCISIDGNEQVNDYLRGKGSCKIAIEALKICKANSLPVRIHCVLTCLSANTIDDFAELAKRYDVPFSYGGYMPNPLVSEEEEKDEFALTNEEIISFYKKYRDYKKNNYPVANSYRTIDYLINWPYGEKRIILEEDVTSVHDHCDNGYYSCFLDPDGMVYACPTLWKMGLNYFEVGAKRSWEYLHENIKCVECIVCPKDFKSILEFDIQVIMEHLRRFFKRGY